MYAKTIFAGAVCATILAMAAATFDVTLVAGGTAYVLTQTQVSLAAASIAALAIAKKAVILASIYDSRRGKRDVEENDLPEVDFAPFFEPIAQNDVAHCGKLMVCMAMAKSEEERTSEEKLVVKLFPKLDFIQNNAFGEYQWAAYAGSFNHPELCMSKFSTCPMSVESLSDFIKVNY